MALMMALVLGRTGIALTGELVKRYVELETDLTLGRTGVELEGS